jgi:hypothetical protein
VFKFVTRFFFSFFLSENVWIHNIKNGPEMARSEAGAILGPKKSRFSPPSNDLKNGFASIKRITDGAV